MAAPPATQKIAFLDQPAFDPSNFAGGYLADFQGKADAGTELVTEAGIRLPPRKCKFVMLANWNTEQDNSLAFTALSANSLYENNGDEIYYGFNGIYVAQLFASQNSGLIPVSDTSQICLRSAHGNSVQVWYAWFW